MSIGCYLVQDTSCSPGYCHALVHTVRLAVVVCYFEKPVYEAVLYQISEISIVFDAPVIHLC